MSTTAIPAVFVLFRSNGKVLLVLRQNTGWSDGMYTMPAGHVEAKETCLAAAMREAKEEVGVTVEESDLEHCLTIHETNATEERFGLTFEASKWKGEPFNAEPEIHGEVAWFDTDNLPSNMVPQAKFSLEQIKAGKTYAEYGW